MKNTYLVLAILFGSFLFAQENNPSVQLEKVTEDIVMIKVFHDNGEIAQSGFVKNNKLEGKWESFTASGDRVSTGNYKEGKKVGQWFFWNEDELTEVAFHENKISSVNLWKDSKTSIALK